MAGDGETGPWSATENEYDVIVLDLMLPGLDGFSLLRALRERGVRSHVLILSARDQVESRVEGLNLGADDYLVKPFSFDEILARIGALVRRSYQEELHRATSTPPRHARRRRAELFSFGNSLALELVKEGGPMLLQRRERRCPCRSPS
jgi:DNA-binding response OmpR family regulator